MTKLEENDLNNETLRNKTEIDVEYFHSILSTIGTNLWRMKQAMIDPTTGEVTNGMKRPFRHLNALWDSLDESNVYIRDHTGEQVPDSGNFGLKVIAYEPQEGLEHEVVIDTLKPTVMYGNQVVQMGEVIVGFPKSNQEDEIHT